LLWQGTYNGYTLDINITDDAGKTPADYFKSIDVIPTRRAIQNALASVDDAEAIYGIEGNQITTYNTSTGSLT
jgi:hypothetical protein